MRPRKRALVDVFVTKPLLAAALDAANQLFLALERRGHRVTFARDHRELQRRDLDVRETAAGEHPLGGSWSPDRATVAYFGTVAIGLSLYEVSEAVDVEWKNDEYVRVRHDSGATKRRIGDAYGPPAHKRDMASGRLALRAYSPYHRTSWERLWSEKVPGEMLSMCETIVRALEHEAPKIVTLIEEAATKAEIERKHAEEQRREWERREVERRRAEEEAARPKRLDAEIEGWRKAREIREYVAATRQLITSQGWKITPGAEVDVWLTWVLGYADRLDPLTKIRRQIDEHAAEESLRIHAMIAAAGVTTAEDNDGPVP